MSPYLNFKALLPRSLLVRTFWLVSLLIVISVAIWLTLFSLASREPRAKQLGQLAISAVNLTRAALIAADPLKRIDLLRDLAFSEGVHLIPAETSDQVEPAIDTPFYHLMQETVRQKLGTSTRFASAINGQHGIWLSFYLDDPEDDYWLMLPSERASRIFPWYWFAWGIVSILLALLVAWLIVSRITQPLRQLALAARDVGLGHTPETFEARGAIELQQLANAFNHMSQDIQRNDAERTEILAGISHDLRTPLARLRLETEMSISDLSAREAAIADIEQIDAIVAQFLNYARGDGGEPAELVDPTHLIVDATAVLARQNLAIDVRTEVLPELLLYPKALKRALSNLLENAIKYGTAPIELISRRVADDWLIDVIDHGSGIPEHETERLKRPFTRLESARTDASGSGLGLAIVARVAKLHDGQLLLLPREGGGLIARLQIPIRVIP